MDVETSAEVANYVMTVAMLGDLEVLPLLLLLSLLLPLLLLALLLLLIN